MNNEVWKDIIGYEGLYQVSDKGRVRSLDKTITQKDGSTRFIKGRIMKTYICKGYLNVDLVNMDGDKCKYKVHRLVAMTFIPNSENKPCVDHINAVKDDNRADNLRWVTYSENMLNPITRKNNSESHKDREYPKGEDAPMYGKKHSQESIQKMVEAHGTKVYCVETDKIYDSIRDASRETGISRYSITMCCNGKKESVKSYHFRYIEEVV